MPVAVPSFLGAGPVLPGDSASALGLVAKHRQARELLNRAQSADCSVMACGPDVGRADPRPPRPSSSTVVRASMQKSSSASALHARGDGHAYGHSGRPASASAIGSAHASNLLRNPLDQRPAGPASVPWCSAQSSASSSSGRACRPTSAPCPRRGDGPHALRRIMANKPPPPLPPLPSSEDVLLQEGTGCARAGPVSSIVSMSPAQPSSPAMHQPPIRETAEPDDIPLLGGMLEPVGEEDHEEDEDADFTEEELALEREVERALKQLEAADAAAAALQLSMENTTDAVLNSWQELSQLRSAVSSWERAAEDGQRELAERKQRLDECFATLPEELVNECRASGVAPREHVDTRRLDIALQRAHVLESQISRLESQISEQQMLAKARLEEHTRLDQQVVSNERERDNLRSAVQEARDRRRSMEAQVKVRENAIDAGHKRKQALDRQVVQLRGEAHGLRARLATIAPPPGATASTLEATNNTDMRSCVAAPSSAADFATEDIDDPDAVAGENPRAASLRLQRQIVDLWEELRRCDAETLSFHDTANGDSGPVLPAPDPPPHLPDAEGLSADAVARVDAAGIGVAARSVVNPVAAG